MNKKDLSKGQILDKRIRELEIVVTGLEKVQSSSDATLVIEENRSTVIRQYKSEEGWGDPLIEDVMDYLLDMYRKRLLEAKSAFRKL